MKALKLLRRVVLSLTLLAGAVLICGATVCYVASHCPNSALDRLSRLLPLLTPFIWPGLTVLLLMIFYRPIRNAMCELPAFVRRSYYGNGGRIVSDVGIKGRDIMVAIDSEDADARIREMRARDFSSCPVLTHDGKFFGVFTIEAWMDYRISHKDYANVTVEEVLSFKENRRLLAETLPYTLFVESDETISDAVKRFGRLSDMGCPLLLLVMSKERRLVNMITPLDALAVSGGVGMARN